MMLEQALVVGLVMAVFVFWLLRRKDKVIQQQRELLDAVQAVNDIQGVLNARKEEGQ